MNMGEKILYTDFTDYADEHGFFKNFRVNP